MSQTKTVKLQIDAEEAIKRLEAVEKELGNISKTAKKTEKLNFLPFFLKKMCVASVVLLPSLWDQRKVFIIPCVDHVFSVYFV